MSKAIRVSLHVLVAMVALPAIGLFVAVLITDDGIERFSSDPVAHWIAQDAYRMAWVHHDNPIQRVLAPAARVVLVANVAGHCTTPKSRSGDGALSINRSRSPAIGPRQESPFADIEREYVSKVRFYTFFGYPADDVFLTCGNSSVSNIEPPEWN